MLGHLRWAGHGGEFWQIVVWVMVESSDKIVPERMNKIGQSRNNTILDVPGGESKVWCCNEQYCIGTWNAKSMNQGKLDMVKQEMTTVNTDILGISEQKWMGMVEFNSDDRYIYYCGQESLRRNGVDLPLN